MYSLLILILDSVKICLSRQINKEIIIINELLELDEQNNITKRYVRGLNLIYTDTKNENNETEKSYYVYNAHGDVVQLVQEDGQVKKSYSYDSFGNEINPSDEDTNPYRYSGEYFDKETETIYLRARYYDPEIGRFITEDSYTGEDNDPLSLNLYTYCHNDGVNNVDPSGNSKVYAQAASDLGKHAKTELSNNKKLYNAKYITKYLTKALPKKRRWTKKAVAGLLGNIEQECKMNPGQWENWNQIKGWASGYGICQWTPSDKFFKWAGFDQKKANSLCENNPKKLLDKQLEYMLHTMFASNTNVLEWYGSMGKTRYHAPYNMTAEQYISSNKKPYELAKIFHGAYLRSADSLSNINKNRAKKAELWFKKIK